MKTRIKNFLREEFVLAALLLLFILLTAALPGYITQYHTFIDWNTIITLTALIIAATGIKESGYLDRFAKKILNQIKTERALAFFLVTLSAVLSAVLTNDITLFIVVPLTLSVKDIIKNDVDKIIIFEALAVNCGSALTPIGNPQNIFLWHMWGISFAGFVLKMLPLVIFMMAALYVFVFISFPGKKLHFHEAVPHIEKKRNLGIISFTLMGLFLLALQFKAGLYLLPVIVIVYLIFYRQVLAKTDWLLLLTFVLMFVDFALISKIPAVASYVSQLDTASSKGAFLISAILSQVMSNVPAAIFMHKFSTNWQAIAYGVSVAGNGVIIGSLANVIAIRLAKSKDLKIWLEFHKYSLAYFAATGIVVYLVI